MNELTPEERQRRDRQKLQKVIIGVVMTIVLVPVAFLGIVLFMCTMGR